MSTPQVFVKTPAIRIVETLFGGRAYLVELPVDAHTVVVEGTSFPPELNVTEFSPRVYSIVGKKLSGSHAHRAGTEDEIMLVVAGEATVHLWDESGKHEEVTLRPATDGQKFWALFIRSGIWHTVRYKPHTALNVVASVHYDREYYVVDPADYFTAEGHALYLHDIISLNGN